MAPATASASPSAGLVSSPPVDAPAITAVPTNAITIPTQPRAEVCSPISGPASATQIGIVCTKTELAAIDVYDSDAMHAARRGHDVTLWGSAHDDRVLERLRGEGKHPSLPEHLPAEVRLFGPGDLAAASAGAEIVILGANSHGARSLAREIAPHVG